MCSAERADALGDQPRPVGVPAVGHRLPRTPLRLEPVVVERHPGDPPRRAAGARAGRARHRRHRRHRPVLVLPVGRPARRRVARARSRPPAHPHRRVAVRRRAVEQLRDARDRRRRRDLRERPGERGLVWANGGYVTKHTFGVYSTEPPAPGFRYEYPQDEIDALPAVRSPTATTPPGPADDRGLHRHVRSRRQRRSWRSHRACSATVEGRGRRLVTKTCRRAARRASGSAGASCSAPEASCVSDCSRRAGDPPRLRSGTRRRNRHRRRGPLLRARSASRRSPATLRSIARRTTRSSCATCSASTYPVHAGAAPTADRRAFAGVIRPRRERARRGRPAAADAPDRLDDAVGFIVDACRAREGTWIVGVGP